MDSAEVSKQQQLFECAGRPWSTQRVEIVCCSCAYMGFFWVLWLLPTMLVRCVCDYKLAVLDLLSNASLDKPWPSPILYRKDLRGRIFIR